eukprot:TRINITY_DN30834_c0_g1_i2.p1 TRINITY_DN30834_c0_g1~~TRINITY_DN30834_c0_g1_i2.p1  ORF type:complete len:488 (-),score=40.49 TRINITY_DN30834_c0_g1_i2:69-1532(-)
MLSRCLCRTGHGEPRVAANNANIGTLIRSTRHVATTAPGPDGFASRKSRERAGSKSGVDAPRIQNAKSPSAKVSAAFSRPSRTFRDSLGMFAIRAADNNVRDPRLWSDVCVELFQRLRRQSPRNICLALNALARVKLRDEALLDHIAGALTASWLRSFNAQDLTLLCNTYARLSHPAPELLSLCAKELLWKLPETTPQEMSLIANAFARQRSYDAPLFRHVDAYVRRRIPEFSPRHAVSILHAFARVDASSPQLFCALAGPLTNPDAASELDAVGVATGCFAIGRAALRHPCLLEANRPLRPALELMARRLVALENREEQGSASVEARHLAALARACVSVGAHSRRLVSVLSTALEARLTSRSTLVGQDGLVGDTRRTVLLDIVDAAVALHESLKRSLSREKNDVFLRECQPIVSVLRSALQELSSGVTATADRGNERRRLLASDGPLSASLQQEWTSQLRPALLGASSVAGVDRSASTRSSGDVAL